MKNHLEQLEVKTAKGSKIFLKNDQVLIDAVSSWWSCCHGYNHPHLIKSITKQAKILPHIMLAGFSNEQTYKLAYRLAKFCEMDKVFFIDSGSVAIELAMKIAWQFFINLKQPNKNKFISFKNSYHGDTTGAMSLADLNSGMHKKFQNKLLANYSLDLPQNKNDLNKFEDFVKKNHHEIAACVIEPLVQCAGGMKFHSSEILKEIFKISKKYNLLFIADECAVGFYRTSSKFAFQQAEIKPDILTIGKAMTGGFLTMSATLTSQEIFNNFLSDSLDNALMHGPTFMGNPLAASSANASLDLFEKINYQEKVQNLEKLFLKYLKDAAKFSIVKEVRVIGAIAVVELKDEICNFNFILKLRKKFISKGVFLRPFANCIYTMPALNISKSEVKKICSVILQILEEESL